MPGSKVRGGLCGSRHLPAGKSPDVLHATATGRQLVRLARLGVARHERHIKKALSWLLERNIDYGDFARRNEAWGGDWVALEAAFLWGREDDKTVQAGVRSIVQNEDRWLGDGRNRHAHALRILLLDRTKCDGPAAGRALRWLVKNQRADGTWPSNSLYECLDTLIRAPRSVGAALVEKALPKLQKTQKRGGSWKFPQRGIAPQTPDEQHVRVLECLVRFGFLEIP